MTLVLFIGSREGNLRHFLPAKKAGYKIAVLKSRPTRFDRKHFNYIIQADVFNTEEVMQKLRDFNKQHKIDAALTRFEAYMPLVGMICDELNLRGPSLPATLRGRDKLLMREAFKEAGVPQPAFMKITKADDLKEAASKYGYPFILKPVSGSKSRYIKKIRSENEIEAAFKTVRNGCRKNKGNLFINYSGMECNDFQNIFIAEEYMEGSQITTTSAVIQGEVQHLALADLETAQDIGIDAFYLISRTTPSLYSSEIQEKVKEVSTKAIRALGLDNTPLHPEFILTDEGPKVIEVSPRFAGYRTEMNWLAFGQDLNKIAIDIALGNDADLEKKQDKASTAVEIWPQHEGTIKEFPDEQKIRELPGVLNLTIKKKKGKNFYLPPRGEKPVASFQTVADTPEESIKIARKVLENFRVIFEKGQYGKGKAYPKIKA